MVRRWNWRYRLIDGSVLEDLIELEIDGEMGELEGREAASRFVELEGMRRAGEGSHDFGLTAAGIRLGRV